MTVIDLAAARGSSATTRAGAHRYLLAHLQQPAEGNDAKRNRRIEWERQRCALRAERIAAGNGLWDRDTADALACELSGLTSLCGTDWPYRKSQSPGSWSFHVGLSDDGLSHYSHRVDKEWGRYSRRCKFPALSESIDIRVTAETAYLFPGLMRNGLFVLDAHRVAPREYTMQWLEQGRGLSEKVVCGYYIRGRHVIAGSIESAREKAAKMRRRAAQSTWECRVDIRTKRQYEKNFESLLPRTWVQREDSIAVGNCVPATDQFARLAAKVVGAPSDPNAFALRADVLLSLRDDSYTRRAIEHAMRRVQL